jgi:hypothetical protein
LPSADWLIIERETSKRRRWMIHLPEISSTKEFKAYEGTKNKLGGFDIM